MTFFSPKNKPTAQPTNVVVQSGSFTSVVFPAVRKVHSQLLAQQIVSVQPMSLPSGMLFHFDNMKRRPVRGQEELNKLFKIWEYCSGKYIEGTEFRLSLDFERWSYGGNHTTVILTSDFYVLSEKNGVGFLCNKSKNDSDFFFVDDLEGYQKILKELGLNENP